MKNSLFLLTLICFYSCETRELKEERLKTEILTLDSLMRASKINEHRMSEALKQIENNLTNNEKMFNDENENWIVNAEIKHNKDSSIIFIRTDEKWKQGFQRQIVVHIGDSVLYSSKFSVLTENNDSLGYELLDVLDYLTERKNIKRLLKREFPSPLNDTTKLRQLTFEPYETTPYELSYKDEVDEIRAMVKK